MPLELPSPTAGGSTNYGSSFLPAVYQGTRIGSNGVPLANATVSNLNNPRATPAAQRAQLDFMQSLNRAALENDPSAAGVEGMIQSYELGFRMQSALPRLMDLNNEPQRTRQMYGIGQTATENFGRQCLLARRFVEAGVRFVEVCQGGWDHHTNLRDNLARNCLAIDKPVAALLADLKGRGLLDETLVMWAGGFWETG